MNILDLGIHRGDEFQMIKRMRKDISDRINFTGIDHCASALSYAKEIFPDKNYRFIESDIKDIDKLELNKQDLIISIGTLQSTDIKGKEIFRYIIQKLINKNAGVILGFPNSRYIDREVIYGAKTKNYREQNMNLLIKDMAFYKKYLQQHGFKVITFGKYYIFLSAFR